MRKAVRRQRRKILGGWIARRRQNKRLGRLVDDLEAKLSPAERDELDMTVTELSMKWFNDGDPPKDVVQ